MSSRTERAEPRRARSGARLETHLIADCLSLFLALPLAATLVVVRYGPASDPGAPLFGGYVPPIALAALALGAAAYRLVFLAPRPRLFVIALSATVAVSVFASVAMGAFAHRDFFTAAFQYPLGALVAILYRAATRPNRGIDRGSLRRLGKTGVIVSAFYVEWIMLMGYAIATRAEPRPIESVVYNVYNLAQVLILFLLSRGIERKSFHAARIEGEAIDVDGRDILPVLGQKKAAIFRGFALVPDRRLHCHEIQALFREEADEAAAGRCASCTELTTKAALCPRYRSTYNSLLELKRILEFLEIGTITAPENKRRILTEGWKLVLFENARLVVKKNK